MSRQNKFVINTSISLREIIEYFLALFFVLNCNTVYNRLSGTNLYIDEVTAVLAVVLVFVRIIHRPVVHKRTLMAIGALLAAFVIYFLATLRTSSQTSIVMLFFITLPCLIFYLSCMDAEKLTEIYRKFSNIVFIISCISTFVWLFSEIIPLFRANMSVTIDWGNVHDVRGFYGLFFECQKENTFGISNFYRNTGIFCEAPMNSLVLSLSFGYEIFLRKKISVFRVILTIFFIITTFSSTGFLCIAVCILLKYFQNSSRGGSSFSVFRFVVLIILCTAAYFFVSILLETKSATGSYSIRMIDYVVGARAWLDHPVFGTGFNNLAQLYEYKASMMADAGFNSKSVGFSNSTMAILGQGGTVLTILYFLPFGMILIKRNEFFRKYKLWTILLMLLMLTTIFHARLIMMYFLAMAYVLAFELGNVKKIGLNKHSED